MKKIGVLLLLTVLLASSVNAITEDEVIILPDRPFLYWIGVTVPQWFSLVAEQNHERMLEKRLEIIDRHAIEFRKVADKLGVQVSEEQKQKLEQIISKIEQKRLQRLDELQAHFDVVSEQKRLEAIARLEEHRLRMQENFDNAIEEIRQKYESRNDEAEITIKKLEDKSILDGFCGDNGAVLGNITFNINREINRERIQATIQARITIPACLCETDAQCPEETKCISQAGDIVLERPICWKLKEVEE